LLGCPLLALSLYALLAGLPLLGCPLLALSLYALLAGLPLLGCPLLALSLYALLAGLPLLGCPLLALSLYALLAGLPLLGCPLLALSLYALLAGVPLLGCPLLALSLYALLAGLPLLGCPLLALSLYALLAGLPLLGCPLLALILHPLRAGLPLCGGALMLRLQVSRSALTPYGCSRSNTATFVKCPAIHPVHGNRCRVAVVCICKLRPVRPGGTLIRHLAGGCIKMAFAHCSFFAWCWPCIYTTRSIKAVMVIVAHKVIIDISVMYKRAVNTPCGRIVEEPVALPSSAEKAFATVPKTVVDAAVKTNT
jgi:hypothetical protein